MLHASDQIRFNQCCNDAIFGYANAMTVASTVMAGQVMGFWSEALQPLAGANEPARLAKTAKQRREIAARERQRSSHQRRRARERERARNRETSSLDFTEAFGRLLFMPWLSAVEAVSQTFNQGGPGYRSGSVSGLVPGFSGWPGATFANPTAMMGAWFDMDFSRVPGSWPMAFCMMAAGVPKAVAWPMAEANLAAMDAFNVAGVAMRRARF